MAENLFTSGEADGASAVAHEFNTTVSLVNAGAKLSSWKNASVEKFYIDLNGYLHIIGAAPTTTDGGYLYFNDDDRYFRSVSADAGTTWEMWFRLWNNYKFYDEGGDAIFWILDNGELDIFGDLKSFKATGTTAFLLDTNVTFTTGDLLSLRNNTSVKVVIDKDGNITTVGTVDGVDVSAHDHSTSTAQTRLAALDRRRFAPSEKEADSAAADARAEHSVVQAQEAITVSKVFFIPDAALTADDADFAVITVWRRDASGGTQTQVASLQTTTGGTGSWTAFDAVDFGSLSATNIAAGQILTWQITKGGSGVIVPSGTLQIEYTID